MSKTVSSTEKQADPPENEADSDLIQVSKEDFEQTKRDYRATKGKLTQMTARVYDLEQALKQKPPETKTPEKIKAEEVGGVEFEEKPKTEVHHLDATQEFCPTCGDHNEEFKPEAECKNCGSILGSLKTLSSVNACPGCGKSSNKDSKNFDKEWKAVPFDPQRKRAIEYLNNRVKEFGGNTTNKQ